MSGSFIQTYSDIVCAVFQVQSCDRLFLEPNQTRYVVASGETIEIRCVCNEGSGERALWYFADGTRVLTSRQIKSRDQPHYKRHKDGGTLILPQISERNGVGLYSCEGGSLTKNISVQLSLGIDA